MNKKFLELYEELCEVVEEIKPYYNVDKIKDYGIYIWTKEDPNRKENYFDYAENLFDIYADEIIFYVKDHKIPDEVMPIIKKIQSKLLKVKFNYELNQESLEVLKEFEKLGYESITISILENHIKIVSSEKTAKIFIDLDEKRYEKTYLGETMSCWLTIQEHQLLTKLFKALGWVE